jgi:hypothetical protein
VTHREPLNDATSDTHRSPLATALTDHFLGAFGITNKTQMTALTDNILGVFGLTDNAEERV